MMYSSYFKNATSPDYKQYALLASIEIGAVFLGVRPILTRVTKQYSIPLIIIPIEERVKPDTTAIISKGNGQTKAGVGE